MLGIEYGRPAILKTWRIVSVRQDGASLLREDATKTGQGAIYVFLRNEPDLFLSENCIYVIGLQWVVQWKVERTNPVRLERKRTTGRECEAIVARSFCRINIDLELSVANLARNRPGQEQNRECDTAERFHSSP